MCDVLLIDKNDVTDTPTADEEITGHANWQLVRDRPDLENKIVNSKNWVEFNATGNTNYDMKGYCHVGASN